MAPRCTTDAAITKWNKQIYPEIIDGELEDHDIRSLATGYFLGLGFSLEDAASLAEDAKGVSEDDEAFEREDDEDDDDEEDEDEGDFEEDEDD
jgi:hypothetical protein